MPLQAIKCLCGEQQLSSVFQNVSSLSVDRLYVIVLPVLLATLHDHILGKVTYGKPPGPATVLTPAEERMLSAWQRSVMDDRHKSSELQ